MRLTALLADSPDATLAGEDRDITALVLDSRKATPGSAFFALPGVAADGARFASAACAAAARR